MAERKAEAETRQREAEARQREAEHSFEKIARKWWEWWSAGKSPRHTDYVLRRLEADVFPAFGHKFIDNVTPADIRKLMLAIESRGARDVAKRAHETTGQIFRYAIAHGIASRNPAADFKPKDILAEANEENFSRVDAKELPMLLAKMVNYDGDAITRLAMRLMAYTFVRTSELIESEWSEFDLDNARWDIPAEAHEDGHAAYRSLVTTICGRSTCSPVANGERQVCFPWRARQEQAHEQQYDFVCSVSSWLQGPNDRSRFSRIGIHDIA